MRLGGSSALAMLVAVALAAPGAARAEAPGAVLVPAGAVWRYLDDGSDAGTVWRTPGFDASSWAAGPAQLGYGDGDENTVVASGPAGAHFITTYFRHDFAVADPASITGLELALLRDDGAAVYLNGVEIVRSNLPVTPIDASTPAVATVGGADESTFFEFDADASPLVAGANVVAVEIHQRSGSSSDISFDLSLVVTDPNAPPTLERGPYLQRATTGGAVIRWRTDKATDTRVLWGDAPGNLTASFESAAATTEHEVELTGSMPDTRLYYAVGTSAELLAGDDSDHFLRTLPAAGTRKPLRLWVVGDSGQCSASAQGCIDAGNVRDAYLAFAGAQPADAWLMLGDNAYPSGTDAQFTAAVFETYPQVLRNTVLWPTPGNHDYGTAGAAPYYDAFTLPTLGESGGVASGTEAYYSFDVGNVHVVSLDSQATDRTSGGTMYTWLEADLMSTDQDWIVAVWHHPPYTKGSHDSDDVADSGGRMRDMREVFVPLLEAYGVDLQLTGHSHSYERSLLLDGHYGVSSTYDPLLHAVDVGDGDPDGDGAYTKSAIGGVPREGAVYSVVGSSSKLSGGSLDHPVMAVGLPSLGSLVLDVVGRQLDGTFLDDSGAVLDHFRLVKGPPLPECDDGLDNDGDGALDHPADIGCKDPSWIEAPECDDGVDNDGDGRIDWDGAGVGPSDPNCSQKPFRRREQPTGCGLGFELALLLLALEGVRRRSSS